MVRTRSPTRKRSKGKKCSPCKPCRREHLKIPTFEGDMRQYLANDCHTHTHLGCHNAGYCEWRKHSARGSKRKTKAMCALGKGQSAVDAGKRFYASRTSPSLKVPQFKQSPRVPQSKQSPRVPQSKQSPRVPQRKQQSSGLLSTLSNVLMLTDKSPQREQSSQRKQQASGLLSNVLMLTDKSPQREQSSQRKQQASDVPRAPGGIPRAPGAPGGIPRAPGAPGGIPRAPGAPGGIPRAPGAPGGIPRAPVNSSQRKITPEILKSASSKLRKPTQRKQRQQKKMSDFERRLAERRAKMGNEDSDDEW